MDHDEMWIIMIILSDSARSLSLFVSLFFFLSFLPPAFPHLFFSLHSFLVLAFRLTLFLFVLIAFLHSIPFLSASFRLCS